MTDSREQLQVRFRSRPPTLHEVEVGVGRADTSPVPKVVRPPRCLRRDGHVARSAFDVHGRYCLQGAGYDGIGSDLWPQVIGLPQKVGENVQGRVQLLLPSCEAAGELSQRIEMTATEVIDVEDASGIQGDIVLMFGAGVPVDCVGQVAACH